MKKLNSKLYQKFEKSRVSNLDTIYGGNNSDVTYSDSKKDGGGYDIAVVSLIDTVDTTNALDKPNI